MKQRKFLPPDSIQALNLTQPGQQSGNSKQKNQKTQEKSNTKRNIIQFEQHDYPFLNQYPINHKIYKTHLIIPKESSESKDFLLKINHPNIICVKSVKEIEIKAKDRRNQLLLDIDYEQVAFSIKFIGFGQRNSSALYQKITQTNLREVLNKVSIYLMKMDINRVIRLIDIGITEQGILKIYVPPSVLQKQEERLPQHAIFSNNYKLVSWWETTFNKEAKQPLFTLSGSPKNLLGTAEQSKLQHSCKQLELKQRQNFNFVTQKAINRKFSKNLGESCKNILRDNEKDSKLIQKIRKVSQQESLQSKGEAQAKRNTTVLKNSSKSYESELTKLASIQMQKMKKIDKQIKQIKEKMEQREKEKRQKYQDSKHYVEKNTYKLKDFKPLFKIFDSQKLDKTDTLCQSINKPQEQPIYRDSIQQNINCINIYHAPTPGNKESFPKKLASFGRTPLYPDPLDGISDQDSLDTYDIQFCNNQEPALAIQSKQSLPAVKYERQISQRNYKSKKEPLHQSRNDKKHKNKVESRKFQTESAGPLQFKNFVNNYIKPQFLAKKSNIYQDPMEEESQHQLPHKVHYKQLAQAGRSVASKTHESQSPKKDHEIKMPKQKQNPQRNTQDINKLKSDINLGAQFNNRNKTDKKAQALLPLGQKQLQNRVHDILMKTKNAIAVLNRMKEGKRLLMRKALSP